MMEYKATTRDFGAEAPALDNGQVGQLVQVVQKARKLGAEREDLEERLMRNQAEITATAGLLQEMIQAMYRDDPTVKYLADAFLFTLTKGGNDPSDKPSPF